MAVRVFFLLSSRARLVPEAGLQLTGPGASFDAAIRTEVTTNAHGAQVSGPLSARVEIDVTSVEEAVVRAHDQVEVAGSLIAFISRAPVGRPLQILAYEIREDDAARPFRPWRYTEAIHNELLPQRRVDVASIIRCYEALDRLDSEDARARVLRALRAHRRALNEDEAIERAILIAVAFEAINPMLSNSLGVADFRIEHCPGCGRESHVPMTGGVDAWLRNNIGVEAARRHRELRNGYLHGYRNLVDMVAIAHDIGLDVEGSLVAAVLELLQLPSDLASDSPMGPGPPYDVMVSGSLVGPVEAGVALSGIQPHVDIHTEIVGSRNVDDRPGNVSVEYDVFNNYTARLPPQVQLATATFVVPHDPEAKYGDGIFTFTPAHASEGPDAAPREPKA